MPVLHITYALGDQDHTEPLIAEIIRQLGPELHCTPSAWLVDSMYGATKAHKSSPKC